MSVSSKNAVFRAGFFLPCLMLCMAPTVIKADETVVRPSILGGDTLRMTTSIHEAGDTSTVPFPFVSDNSAGLNFDLVAVTRGNCNCSSINH
jgi:hypothetical protein